jgi:hypothetical protein
VSAALRRAGHRLSNLAGGLLVLAVIVAVFCLACLEARAR